jgi:hypothetical protein
MGFAQASAAQNSETEIGKFELSAATQRLLSQFGLIYPIFQAATGGTFVDGDDASHRSSRTRSSLLPLLYP